MAANSRLAGLAGKKRPGRWRPRRLLCLLCLFSLLPAVGAWPAAKLLRAVKIGSYQDKTRVVLTLNDTGFYELAPGPAATLLIKLYDFSSEVVPAHQLLDERLIKALDITSEPQFLQVKISFKRDDVRYQAHLFTAPPMLVIDLRASSPAAAKEEAVPAAGNAAVNDGPLPAAGEGAAPSPESVADADASGALPSPTPSAPAAPAAEPTVPVAPATASGPPEPAAAPGGGQEPRQLSPVEPAKNAAGGSLATAPAAPAAPAACAGGREKAAAAKPAAVGPSTKGHRQAAGEDKAAVRQYEEGLRLFQAGDFAAAMETFDRLLRTCPRSPLVPKALFRYNDARFRLARERQAINLHQVIDTYLQAVRRYPDDSDAPWALMQVARAYEELGFIYEAEGVYRAVVKQYPASPLVPGSLYAQAKINFSLKRYRQAEALYHRLLTAYPRRGFAAEAAYYQANCRYHLGDYQQAMVLYEQARRDFPAYLETDPQTLYLLGSCCLRLRRLAEARDYLLRLRNLFPRSSFTDLALAKVGQALLAEGKTVAALEILAAVVKEYPGTDGELIARLAMAGLGARHDQQWRRQEKLRPFAAFLEPVAAYQQIITQHGDNALSHVACLRLALLLFERRQYAQARKYFDQLLAWQPDPEIRTVAISSMKRLLRVEAGELYRRGDYARLLALQKQYGSTFLSRPQTVYPFFWFAEAMRHEGLYAGALRVYSALQACKPTHDELLAITYGMADCHLHLGEAELAAGLLATLGTAAIPAAWQGKIMLLQARVDLARKKFPAALRRLRQLAAQAAAEPAKQVEILTLTGEVHAAAGDRSAADRAYRQALALAAEHPGIISPVERFNLYSALARFLFAGRQYNRALAAFQRAALLSEQHEMAAEMLYWQSLCYARLNQGKKLTDIVRQLQGAYADSKWSVMASAVVRDYEWQRKNRNLKK